MVRRLMEHVDVVAAAEGVDRPGDPVERGAETAHGLEADAYASLQCDLIHDKPMELETLHGAVVRRGREHGVDVPTTEAVYAIRRRWAERNRPSQE